MTHTRAVDGGDTNERHRTREDAAAAAAAEPVDDGPSREHRGVRSEISVPAAALAALETALA